MADIEVNLLKLCRLCGSDGGIRINIFEPAPGYIGKIEALVPNVVILRYDCFPKSLCHRCVAKLKEYHDFRENCVKTQERFRKLVPWLCNPDSAPPEISNQSTVASPMVLYMGGSPAHPFGDPEPKVEVVEVLTVSDDDEDVSDKVSTLTADVGAPHSAKRRRSGNVPLKGSVHPHAKRETDQHHISSGSIPSVQSLFRSNTTPEGLSINYVPKSAVKQGGGLPPNALTSNSQVRGQSLPPPVTNHSENPKIFKALHTTSRPSLPLPTTHHAEQRAVPVSSQPEAQQYLKGPTTALPLSNNSVNNLSTSQHKAQHSEQTKKSQDPGPQTSVPAQPVPSVRPAPAFYKSVRITDEKKAETDKSPIKLKISAVHSVEDAAGHWTNRNGYSKGSNAIAAEISNSSSTQIKNNPARRPKPKSKQNPQSKPALHTSQEQEYLSEELKEQCQPPRLKHQLHTEDHLPHCAQQQSQQKQTDDKGMHHPKIQSIQISKTRTVFTCNECNRIYVNQESVVSHYCSGSKLPNATLSVSNIRSSAVNDSADRTESSGQNVCKDQTNMSENSSGLNIPCIPIVDDESPSSPVKELLTCKKCFKVFHSCTRLDKHQTSCLGVA